MVKVSILYPNIDGARFDMDYYLHTHMPLSIERLGAAEGYQGVSVERGIGGGAPGAAPAYVAMCHYLFDSAEAFLAAFNPNAGTLQGDMANFTDIEPTIQISQVEIAR
jgi:uncharacterized protein (TIGR02118 family)